MGVAIFNRDTGMGSHIFGILGVRFKREDFYCMYFIKCVNSFQEDLVKRLYKADAQTEDE